MHKWIVDAAALNGVGITRPNYYRHGASKRAFHWADHHVNAKLRRWAKRRHSNKTAAWRRSRYFDAKWNFVDGRTRLARHDEVRVTRHA